MHTFWSPNGSHGPRHSLLRAWKLEMRIRQLSLSESLEGIDVKAFLISVTICDRLSQSSNSVPSKKTVFNSLTSQTKKKIFFLLVPKITPSTLASGCTHLTTTPLKHQLTISTIFLIIHTAGLSM